MMSDPSPAELLARAQQAHQAGQLGIAEELYSRFITRVPDHAEAHHLLGLARGQRGDRAGAIACIRRAIVLESRIPSYHNNLGELYRRSRRPADAEACFRSALALKPDFAVAHYNLANLLKSQGRYDEAIEHYRLAIQYRPDYARAYYNLGNTFLDTGRFRSAADCLETAVELKPGFARAYNNLGVAYQELGQLDQAILALERAAASQPDFHEAYRNLASTLDKQGQFERAGKVYERALELEPGNQLLRLAVETRFPLIAPSHEAIDAYWKGLGEALEGYHGLQVTPVQLGRENAFPPSLMAYHGRDVLPMQQRWARLFESYFPREPLAHAGSARRGDGRPHIGFVVTHGHEGVFLKCMRGILDHLPADRFRLTVVCSQQAGKEILQSAIANPEVRYLAVPSDLTLAAEIVGRAAFDVLYYWEVGTDSLNYFLPFYRLAPVQCATWGWPVTTGIPQVDFYVSSEPLETEESDGHYSETLVRLKRLPTYYYRPPVPEVQRSRGHFGLGVHDHLYLCTQNLRKVHPDFDSLAAGVLRADPRGRLLFVEDAQPGVTDLLRRRLERSMPDVVGRVRFMPRLPEPDYLNLVALADVILDTVHYCGGANTAYDAFAAGTPVVTMPGRFHRGRYTAAAYRQIGVLDCVADGPEAYVELALRLGSDRAYREQVSARIQEQCCLLFEDLEAVEELANFFEDALARTE